MTQDKVTDHYEISVEFSIQPVNKYGDVIGDGYITYRAKTKADNLQSLGELLERTQKAIIQQ